MICNSLWWFLISNLVCVNIMKKKTIRFFWKLRKVHFEKKRDSCTLLSPYRNVTIEFEHSKHQIIQLLFHRHGVCTPNFCSASFGSKNFNKKNHKPKNILKILCFYPCKTLEAKPSSNTFKQSFLESDTMKIFTLFS